MRTQSQWTRAHLRDPISSWPCAKTRFLMRLSSQVPGVRPARVTSGGDAMQPVTLPGPVTSPAHPADFLGPHHFSPGPSRLASHRPSASPSVPPLARRPFRDPRVTRPVPPPPRAASATLRPWDARWPVGHTLTCVLTSGDPSPSQGPADAQAAAGRSRPSALWPGPHARHALSSPGLTYGVW